MTIESQFSCEMKKHNIVMLMGMPRAATTFLYHHLDEHPEIFVPYRRKTNYFSVHYKTKSADWFYSHFKAAKHDQVCVDTETLGFIDKELDILERIEEVLGAGGKYILCVREPGEWFYSLYCQVRTFQKDIVPFDEFIAGKFSLSEDGLSFTLNYQNGDIKNRILEMEKQFGDRLLLLDFKELQQNPNSVLVEIEKFLNLKEYYFKNPVSEHKINASSRKNYRVFTGFIRNPLFIWFASLLPVMLVKKFRKLFDYLSVNLNSGVEDSQSYSYIALAREKFSDDVEYYKKMFPSGE